MNISLTPFKFRGTTQEEKDKEITDYLFKLREEIEDALNNIGTDNLGSEFADIIANMREAMKLSLSYMQSQNKNMISIEEIMVLGANNEITCEGDGFAMVKSLSATSTAPTKLYVNGRLIAQANYGNIVTCPVKKGDRVKYTIDITAPTFLVEVTQYIQ